MMPVPDIILSVLGTVHCLHHDELALFLTDVGQLHIRRASHVEPTADGHWTADLSPMNGPVLGPFVTRAQAILAERDWLTRHRNL